MSQLIPMGRASGRRFSGKLGAALLALHLFVALAAPALVPYEASAQSSADVLRAPSASHWLGTDHLGRDVLTRLLLGGRTALWITGLSAALAVLMGSVVGLLAGFLGGLTDEVLMRLNDSLHSFPWLLLVLLVVSVSGSGPVVLIVTLAVTYATSVARVARAAALEVVAENYVLAARLRGERTVRILVSELLPNVRDVLFVEGAMQWSWMLLAFSSLSFLGFGVRPPSPDWGLMIAEARTFLSLAPWAALAPMVALSSLIVGINLSADAIARRLGVDRAQRAPL
jgi:peptide/nickel transport system permease protein